MGDFASPSGERAREEVGVAPTASEGLAGFWPCWITRQWMVLGRAGVQGRRLCCGAPTGHQRTYLPAATQPASGLRAFLWALQPPASRPILLLRAFLVRRTDCGKFPFTSVPPCEWAGRFRGGYRQGYEGNPRNWAVSCTGGLAQRGSPLWRGPSWYRACLRGPEGETASYTLRGRWRLVAGRFPGYSPY